MKDSTLTPRERLLETAADLFYQKGISLGVNELFDRSGVSRATFYRHFASKEQLIEASLELRVERWRSWFRAAVEERTDDPRERLYAIFDVFEEYFSDPQFRGCTAINFSAEVANTNSKIHQLAWAHKEQVRQYIETLAESTGIANAKELAEELLLLINGATVIAHLSSSNEPAKQAKRAAQSLIEKALDQ